MMAMTTRLDLGMDTVFSSRTGVGRCVEKWVREWTTWTVLTTKRLLDWAPLWDVVGGVSDKLRGSRYAID